ncbi:hypothetical protein [Boudabousia tangfeifanii]|uniref:hypothetical protein n=1 Tax=Boudabousia tangfeifanii TaxID=1912795 RepID=UPI00195E0D79|nr:hypothetical protein [Boudabousia tangfeifanii]
MNPIVISGPCACAKVKEDTGAHKEKRKSPASKPLSKEKAAKNMMPKRHQTGPEGCFGAVLNRACLVGSFDEARESAGIGSIIRLTALKREEDVGYVAEKQNDMM